jgi:hypothetical protein
MSDNLEDRIRQLEQSLELTKKPTQRKLRPGWGTVLVCLAILLFGSGAGLYAATHRSIAPSEIGKLPTNFTVYYPHPLLEGYAYRQGSAKYEGGILSYSLQSKGSQILINEQALPATPPDLSVFPDFKKFTAPSGTGVVGVIGGKPTAVLQASTTLISFNSGAKTPSTDLSRLALEMKAL